MGIHSGEPECKLNPITGRVDYYGAMVSKSSRIQTLARGGQVLVSEKVLLELEKDEDLLKNSSVLSLGRFKLRGLKVRCFA
jgi:class 3 adenylate cyclase